MRRLLLLVLPLLIVVLIGFVGVSADSSTSGDDVAAPAVPGEAAVAIAGFDFAPADLTVAAGTEVTWTNEDGSPHSIQDDSGEELFAEGDELDEGDTFAFTYAQAGEYAYICGVHNYMTGIVTVTA